MAYKLSIKLPEGWQQETQVAKEEDGTEITHLEAHLPDDKNEKDLALIDICLGWNRDGVLGWYTEVLNARFNRSSSSNEYALASSIT